MEAKIEACFLVSAAPVASAYDLARPSLYKASAQASFKELCSFILANL